MTNPLSATPMAALVHPEPLTVANGGYASPSRLWWSVGIFFLVSVLSIMDRQILFLMVDPVRADLHISDVQVSLLQGMAFSLFYATVGLPVGMLADRWSRKWILIGGVSLWSLATAMGGLAQSFEMLFLSRILVGLGEAALSPCVVSMIGDLAPPERRGRPVSIFLMGQALGKGLTLLLVGVILAAVPGGHFDFLPLLGDLAAWRVAFLIFGVVGFFVVGLMLTLREPVRRRDSGVVSGPTVAQVFEVLASKWRISVPFYLAFGVYSIASYGIAAWVPTVLTRQFGMPLAQVGGLLGPGLIVTGVVGAFAGGFLADRAARVGGRSARMTLLVLAPLLLLPGALATLAPNGPVAITLVCLSIGCTPIVGTLHLSVIQDIFPASMRGITTSLVNFVATVIGLSFGPLAIAAVTQNILRDDLKIGTGLALVTVPALLVTVALYRAVLVNLRKQEQ